MSRRWCSTRRTAWPTWVSSRRSAACSTRRHRNRQVLLFSATIGREVESIIRNYQHDPVRVAIEATEEAKGDVAHHFWKVDRAERVAITAKLIEHHGQAFVFCRTKRGADRVVRQLQAQGVRAVPMHGDRTQGQRERALDSFAKGKADALVATDVVARGIHVDALPVRGPFRPAHGPRRLRAPFRSDGPGRSHRDRRLLGDPGAAQGRPRRAACAGARARSAGAVFCARWPLPLRGTAEAPKTRKLTGTVKFFNSARGYGFVEHHGGEDLFVHHSQVEGDARNGIAPGSTVEFTIGAGRRGDEAHNVKVL